MRQNYSLHESYRDDESIEAGSDRSFGCMVGSILVVIGAAKAFVAGALSPVACLIFAPGVVLLLLGVFAPSRLSKVKRIWLKVGALMARLVNPIVLGVLFLVVVTPMALLMRMAGKRPLGLAPNRVGPTYWISRDPTVSAASSMKRQF